MTATHNHDNPQLITCATKIRKRRQFVASYQNIPQLLFGCHLDITFAQHYPASAVLQLKEINVLVTYFCYFQQYPVLLFSFSIPFFRLTFLSHFDFLSCEKNTYIWSTKKLCWKRNQSIVYSCFSRLAMINGQYILTCKILYNSSYTKGYYKWVPSNTIFQLIKFSWIFRFHFSISMSLVFAILAQNLHL